MDKKHLWLSMLLCYAFCVTHGIFYLQRQLCHPDKVVLASGLAKPVFLEDF